jgi:nitrous-oxide reductase
MLTLVTLLGASSGCFQEDRKRGGEATKEPSAGDVSSPDLKAVAERRGLSDADLIAAAETFVPTGGRDTHLGLIGTGTSGRAAVFGMPSMRILKYVGVFTPEAWQGFAYDDESKAILASSAREDVAYLFGDLGLPSLSRHAGKADGGSAFFVDAANARVAVVAMDDYETKQIVVNPVFRGSYGALATTDDGNWIVQGTAAPEIPGGAWAEDGDAATKARGGLTLWRYEEGEGGEAGAITPGTSFTVELPPYLQGKAVAGRGPTSDFVFVVGRCRSAAATAAPDEPCLKGEAPAVLHVVRISVLADVRAGAETIAGHAVFPLVASAQKGALKQVELPAGAETVSISPDGTTLVVTGAKGTAALLLDAVKASQASGGANDAFGVPTAPLASAEKGRIEVGGGTTGAAFGASGAIYVAAQSPGRLVRASASGQPESTLTLGFEPSGVMVPEGGDGKDVYAVVANKRPRGRWANVGPVTGLNAQLIDVSAKEMRPLYDMSVAQANALHAIGFPADLAETIVRYKSGTDSRTGKMSLLRTVAGQEKIIREGNRVHVFASLVRSHITPELVEVNEGDIVTFHITNQEQAEDQTHGFTVGTYNVHGSWEPGKTASVTFTANRPGVFPYYCTEFCSALHLEMEGYLLVKPKGWKPSDADLAKADTTSGEADKAEYEAKMKAISDTQAVIDSVVAWLKENDYAKDDRAAALVSDAVEQLGKTPPIQAKIDAAAKAGDWKAARLWAEQYYQYQVKAADAGLRAKKILTENGGKK